MLTDFQKSFTDRFSIKFAIVKTRVWGMVGYSIIT